MADYPGWVIDNQLLQGYPSIYIDETTPLGDFGPIETPPYPKNMMYIDSNPNPILDGYPILDTFKDFGPVETPPHPKNMMHIDNVPNPILNGYPILGTFKDFGPVEAPPHPKNMMHIDNDILEGYPSFNFMGNFEMYGAFKYCENLTEVIIPSTVKFISDYTFYGTSIKNVTIAPDCRYFNHSFPEDCQIEFYE